MNLQTSKYEVLQWDGQNLKPKFSLKLNQLWHGIKPKISTSTSTILTILTKKLKTNEFK